MTGMKVLTVVTGVLSIGLFHSATWSDDAVGSIANDRDSLIVQLSPPDQSAWSPFHPAETEQRLKTIPVWDMEVINDPSQDLLSTTAIPTNCKGSLANQHIQPSTTPGAMGGITFTRWVDLPCYRLATTNYVESRIVEMLPEYFKQSAVERNERLEAKIDSLEQTVADLTARLKQLEAQPNDE